MMLRRKEKERGDAGGKKIVVPYRGREGKKAGGKYAEREVESMK
jgi:hypothetical protein